MPIQRIEIGGYANDGAGQYLMYYETINTYYDHPSSKFP